MSPVMVRSGYSRCVRMGDPGLSPVLHTKQCSARPVGQWGWYPVPYFRDGSQFFSPEDRDSAVEWLLT